MRKLLCAFLLLCGCSAQGPDVTKEQIVKTYFAWLIYTQYQQLQRAYDYSPCVEYGGALNGFYTLPHYYSRFMFDQTQYRVVVIGDSTMDINQYYAKFISPGTQVVAVGGNKLCDMIVQTPAINTSAPEHVVISTGGGNDMLARMHNDLIVKSAKELIDKIRNRFPAAKISVVGIHPTRSAYGNANKSVVNTEVKNYLSGVDNSCFYDPIDVFSVAEGEPAPENLMLDSIHYNDTAAYKIRENLYAKCGVLL